MTSVVLGNWLEVELPHWLHVPLKLVVSRFRLPAINALPGVDAINLDAINPPTYPILQLFSTAVFIYAYYAHLGYQRLHGHLAPLSPTSCRGRKKSKTRNAVVISMLDESD